VATDVVKEIVARCADPTRAQNPYDLVRVGRRTADKNRRKKAGGLPLMTRSNPLMADLAPATPASCCAMSFCRTLSGNKTERTFWASHARRWTTSRQRQRSTGGVLLKQKGGYGRFCWADRGAPRQAPAPSSGRMGRRSRQSSASYATCHCAVLYGRSKDLRYMKNFRSPETLRCGRSKRLLGGSDSATPFPPPLD
jgi:hypothetical protein